MSSLGVAATALSTACFALFLIGLITKVVSIPTRFGDNIEFHRSDGQGCFYWILMASFFGLGLLAAYYAVRSFL